MTTARVQQTRRGRSVVYEWRCRDCARHSPGTFVKEKDAQRSATGHNAQHHREEAR